MLKIIDVSQNNGVIDWQRVKPHIDGAILRVGYRGYGWAGTLVTDSKLHEYMRGALAAGIPVGAYWVSQATSDSEALAEAEYVHSLIKGYQLSLPVFLDSEWGEYQTGTGRADRLRKKARTQYGLTLLRKLRDYGYQTGLYTGLSWFTTELDGEAFRADGHFIWLASVEHVEPTIKYDGWQYTWRGKIDGIYTDVDVSKYKEEALQRMGKYFADTSGHWAEDAIDRMKELGLINGRTETTFDPDTGITRAELAAVLDRLTKKLGLQ